MVAMSLLGDSLGFYVATGMGFLHEGRTSAMGAAPGGRFEFEDVQINRTAAFVGSNALGANAYSAAQFAASQFCESSGGCP